jgi:hypothetical protein
MFNRPTAHGISDSPAAHPSTLLPRRRLCQVGLTVASESCRGAEWSNAPSPDLQEPAPDPRLLAAHHHRRIHIHAMPLGMIKQPSHTRFKLGKKLGHSLKSQCCSIIACLTYG